MGTLAIFLYQDRLGCTWLDYLRDKQDCWYEENRRGVSHGAAFWFTEIPLPERRRELEHAALR